MSVRKSKNPVVATLSGAIAGGVEACAVWPMESAKTMLQLQERAGGAPKYTGTISCMRYTVNQHGFVALYRGLLPVLLASIPKAGIRFGGFQFFKDKFAKEDGSSSPLRTLAAGMSAGAIEATLIVTPAETVKTRLIDGNAGFWSGVRAIVAKEGVGGLYKGLAPTVLKQSSNQGVRFMVFNEMYKPLVAGENGKLTPLQALLGGMFSGCVSTMANNPADAVKTRMQGLEAAKYRSTMHCASVMLRTEGVASFYAGVVPRLGRVGPGQGIIFLCFESIQEVIEGWVG